MNKAELINHVANSTGISKSKAAEVINAFTEAVQSSLEKSERVSLVGFGTFETSNRQARKGRNPQTGEEILIPAKRVAKFRPSVKLLTR